MASVNPNLPQLSDENFSNWKFRVECLLEEKGVRELTLSKKSQEDLEKLNDKSLGEYKTKDAKARAVIVQCITDRHLEYVKDCETAYDMFVCLKNVFERKSTLSKLYIRRQLLSLKCHDNEKLHDHFIKFDSLMRDLESTGCKIDEDDKVCHLLLTMPKKYETVITVLETTTTDLTLDLVKSKLLDVELKLRNNSQLTKSDKSLTDDCSFSVGLGKGYNKSRPSSYDKQPKPRCFRCNNYDHLIADCPFPQSNNPNNNRGRGNAMFRDRRGRLNYGNRGRYNRSYSNQSRANMAHEDRPSESDDGISFIALSSEKLKHEEGLVNFVIDSGATNNMVSSTYEEYMSEVTDIVPITLKVANGETMLAKRQGKLKVKCLEDNNSVMGQLINIDALIIETLPYNLLSVQKMNRAGCSVIFEKGRSFVNKKNTTLFSCKMVNNLFVACFALHKPNYRNGKVFVSGVSAEILWHQRLGHLNRQGLNILKLPCSKAVCDACKKGKATRPPFKETKKPRSSRIGELLYSDVWGPINEPTQDGEKYYLSVVDDYSHFTHVYLLTSKSEAEPNLRKHIEQLKAQNIVVSRLRTDNGKEFITNSLQKYCTENGIRHEYTATYTPQQCGVAERLNRTLLDKVRSMFVETNLPKYLWGEAIRCAAYQLNRSPTRALFGEVPANIYIGELNLERLRVFGSKAWVCRLPKVSKLEPRASEMRMVGYAGSGYRLWNPENNNVVISRDVSFDESDYKYSPNSIYVRKQLESSQHENGSYETDTEGEEAEVEQTTSPGNRPEQKSASPENRRRPIKTPKRFEDFEIYSAFCLLTCDNDPKTYKEALQAGDEWKKAIDNELEAHKKFETWTISDLPPDKSAIETRWVFKTKSDGVKKARLVAKGYQETFSSNEVYAPVAKMATIRMTMSHAMQNDYKLRHLDVPSAFLNGKLSEEVYIKIPDGVNKPQGKVLKLNKALYGLKEAPRCWNECFNDFAAENGLKRSAHDVCLYYGKDIWLTLFVDDCLLTGTDKAVEILVKKLKQKFNAKDLGNLTNFLGTSVTRDENCLVINQKSLIEKILKRFNMEHCKGISTPMEVNFQVDPSENVTSSTNFPYRELIGSLNYLAMISRPDICFPVSFLGRFLDKPTVAVWKAAKRVLQYVKSTIDLSLTFKKSEDECLIAYSDADWGSDKFDRKSMTGLAVYHCNNLVSWCSKKQQVVSLSTAEAEYIAAAHCAAEVLYLQGLAADFNNYKIDTQLLVDNQSAISMIKNYENSRRSKHIDIKAHFIKDIVNKGMLQVSYVPSESNVADIFTKSLSKPKFTCHVSSLNLKQPNIC